MTLRFISYPSSMALATLLCTGLASAQTASPATVSTPAATGFRSAFEGYQPYTEEKTQAWKEANDTAGRIGGWRAYAKEAQQPAAADNAAPKAAAQPAPQAGHTKP